MGELIKLHLDRYYVDGLKSADPPVGIITKPDDLIPGSRREQFYAALAQNKEVEFRLGWHVLKNMDSDKGLFTLANRNTEEEAFFSQGIWKNLPAHLLGIFELRARLSKVLMRQIAYELPNVKKEIESKLKACQEQLEKMGQPRTTIDEQRLYLVKVSQSFQTLTKACVDGIYTGSFFKDAESNLGLYQRIRACIQLINYQFAKQLELQGQYRQIVDGPVHKVKGESADGNLRITRSDFVSHVQRLMHLTRGRELPGTFSPMTVADLFKEQCRPWKALLQEHIKEAGDSAEIFLKLVCVHVADKIGYRALQNIIDPAMKRIMVNMQVKADELLRQHNDLHPITYNHYFTENLQKVRDERKLSEVRSVVAKWLGTKEQELKDKHDMNGTYDIAKLIKTLTARTEPDMDRFAASESLDCMMAYYKVSALTNHPTNWLQCCPLL